MSSPRSESNKEQSAAVAAFYSSIGQALADDANYPAAIRQHLDEEKAILSRHLAAGKYSVVVEVGCMDGRLHMAQVLRFPLRYVGIDLVAESVRKLNLCLSERRVPASRAVGLAMDACQLAKLDCLRDESSALVIFPFNSFGNMAEPSKVIAAAARLTVELLIFTYRTDEASNELRASYYRDSGMTNLECITNRSEVRFSSSNGLVSHAYTPRWFETEFARFGYRCAMDEFGRLGLVVHAVLARKIDD